MLEVIYEDELEKKSIYKKNILPSELIINKRNLTSEEINILKENLNTNEDSSWQNIFVDKNNFNPNLIRNNNFSGFVVIGKLVKAKLKYHDLTLSTGIFNSYLKDVVIGDDNVIANVRYLENYRLGKRVILFNVQEISCTKHSKFGNGFIKKDEPESNRINIAVANENEGRAILPFEQMITADAYLWSRYRDDSKLMDRFKEITESYNSKDEDTYGIIEDDVIIKNTSLIKDAKIGCCSYIKGAFKIKNVTILSSEKESSQIGEGVELVNGIMGYGSRVFYQAVAVRFVIGKNCQLKYGARLLNSVLGDNSTVSCCELLNNLIFPFHEQHHNSSFLIATTIMGQSNIASGATIGSNHNSRSPDGEIIAGRGFWPGLCCDFKHNSRFASFTLVAKGSYQQELNILYPFSLVSKGKNNSESISIMPAWWFMYDMFAIVRNRYKFVKRDKRIEKVQNIEVDPFAPDTMEEVIFAVKRIIDLTKEILPEIDSSVDNIDNDENKRQCAKDFLHKNENTDFELFDKKCQKKFGAVILKPIKAYRMYRKILKYYSAKRIIEYCNSINKSFLTKELLNSIYKIPLYTKWANIGGQIVPEEKVLELIELIKSCKINTWEEIHKFYDKCNEEYKNYEVRFAFYILEELYSCSSFDFTQSIYQNIVKDVLAVSNDMYESSVSSREKDYTDYYRTMTYRNKEEMNAVLGSIKDNDFLTQLKIDTETFNKNLESVFSKMM